MWPRTQDPPACTTTVELKCARNTAGLFENYRYIELNTFIFFPPTFFYFPDSKTSCHSYPSLFVASSRIQLDEYVYIHGVG